MSGLLPSPEGRAEWRRAWPVPFVCALGYGASVAHIYSAGLFIAPLEREFGWSRAAITGGLSVVSIFSVILSPFVGALIDRWGARRIGLPGIALYCSAIAALSLAGGSLWSWWALWVLIAFASLMVKSTVWTSAVASRFDKSRGLAMAVALCGAGVGSALLPLLTSQLIAHLEWRNAYVALGAILAMITIPLLLPFFRDARDMARRAPQAADVTKVLTGLTFRRALRSSRFFRIAAVATLSVTSMTALLVHMVPILNSQGFSTIEAASLAGLVGIGSVLGRLGTGFLLDWLSGALIGTIAFAAPILAVLALYFAGGSPLVAGGGCLLLGLALGTEVDVIGYLTSRYFGMLAFGAVFGTIVGLQSLATGVGPLIASLVYDHSGGYDPLLLGVLPVFALCAILTAGLGGYPDLDSASAVEATQ